jgi:hypothetical protein
MGAKFPREKRLGGWWGELFMSINPKPPFSIILYEPSIFLFEYFIVQSLNTYKRFDGKSYLT